MAIFKGDQDPTDPQPASTAIPLLPLRDIVIFPEAVVPLFVGREPSVRALDEAMLRGRQLVLAAQRNAKTDSPGVEDISGIYRRALGRFHC